MRKHISTLLLVFCLTFVAASAYNQTLSYTLDNVFETSAAAASARLVGGGLTLGPVPTAIARTGSGDEILWQQARLVTDPRGGQHAFYDQVVRTARGDIPLVGSEIGVHTHNGRVIVAGGQYRTVTIANAVRLSRDDAPRAISRAMAARGWRTVDFDTLPLSDRARIFGELRLVLAPVNGAFRYAYQGRAVAADGREYSTLLDADTEDVLSITAATVSSNCSATPATSATAIGTPLRPDVATRSIWANSAARLNGFTYEAYAAATPPITVFQEPMTGNSAFWCSPTSGFRYTVFPVALSGGTPIYDDGDPNWKGKTAGDAMYRTRQTMNAFQSMGRSGWDRTNGLAQAVIQSNAVAVANCPDSCASFLRTADIQAGDQVPSGGALVMRPGTALLYNSAAALDQIAHEWGHGVIFTDVPNLISGNPEFGHAMHEGWADVIGQMVEKLTEPVGGTNPAGSTYPAGPEMSRDWDLGEDMVTDSQAFTQSALHYQYAYSGARDDGTAGHSFGNYTINMRLHKNDDPVQPGTPQDHSQGNMLNVVYKILTEGGANPACVRLGTVCNTGSGVGLSSASAIMFDTIQYWVTYNVDWDTLRSAMKAAAFDHFNTCPSYNASAEQLNVRLAFTAIGYSEPFPIHDIQCP